MLLLDSLTDANGEALRRLAEGKVTRPDEIFDAFHDKVVSREIQALFAAADVGTPPVEPGAVIDRFTIDKVLSEPEGQLCYLATSSDDSAQVVLKELIETEPADRARALLAQQRVAATGSDAIALPTGLLPHEGRWFVVRSFVDGISLETILQRLGTPESPPGISAWRVAAGGPAGGAALPGEQLVCRLGMVLARALQEVHERGTLHGALKPRNIICNGSVRPTVVDFGMGPQDPAFEAPEILAGSRAANRSARSDLYSLGAILHRCLTLGPLFGEEQDGDSPVRPSQQNPTLAKDLEAIVMTLLEQDPSQRYLDARELLSDLDHCRRGEPIEKKPGGVLRRWFH